MPIFHYMKINDTLREVIDILDARFADPVGLNPYHPRKIGYFDHYNDDGRWVEGDVTVDGLTADELAMLLGAELCSAATTQALVMRDVVLKWTYSTKYHAQAGSDTDEMIYAKAVDLGISHSLATTIRYGNYTIQETIIPAVNLNLKLFKTDEEIANLYTRVIDVAVALGIGDIHPGNWGFRANDIEYNDPVIFDFSCVEDYSELSEMSAYQLRDKLNLQTWGIGVREYGEEIIEEHLNEIIYQAGN